MPDLLGLQPLPSPNGSLKNKNRLRSRQTVFCWMDGVSGCPALCSFQVIQAGDAFAIMLIGAAAKHGGGFFILPFDVFHSGFP